MLYFNRHTALYGVMLAVIIFGVFSVFIAPSASAQFKESDPNTYTFLTPIPGFDATEPLTSKQGGLLERYITVIFRLLVITITFIAAVMIVFAGIQYVASGASPSQRDDARQRIESAIYGLLIVLGSIFLLNQINPNIVGEGFALDKILKEVRIAHTVTVPETFSELDTINKSSLLTKNGVGTKALCALPSSRNCVSLSDIKQNTIMEVIFFDKLCKSVTGGSCSTIVTGGTETFAHSPSPSGCGHHEGCKIDIRYNDKILEFISDHTVATGLCPYDLPKPWYVWGDTGQVPCFFKPLSARSSDGALQWQMIKTGSVYALENGTDGKPSHFDIKVKPDPTDPESSDAISVCNFISENGVPTKSKNKACINI